jgi:hypothetical protein
MTLDNMTQFIVPGAIICQFYSDLEFVVTNKQKQRIVKATTTRKQQLHDKSATTTTMLYHERYRVYGFEEYYGSILIVEFKKNEKNT